MFDFGLFEEATGHALTLVQSMRAGVSTYYCEHCGAIVVVGGPDSGLLVFHVPTGSISTEDRCRPPVHTWLTWLMLGFPVKDRPTLKSKLEALDRASYERLRRI